MDKQGDWFVNMKVRKAILLVSLGLISFSSIAVVLASGPSTSQVHSTSTSDAALRASFANLLSTAPVGSPPPSGADGVGAFDTETAEWHLRTRGGDPAVFLFGSPGQYPLVGDWDGDGIDTIGTYDAATGIVSLRYTNSSGPADLSYALVSGEIPIAGDFDGDGIDTVATFNPNTGTLTIGDGSGQSASLTETALTVASGHVLFVGDFDGDGQDTVGIWNPREGVATLGTTPDSPSILLPSSDEQHLFFVGDWTGNGVDTPGTLDPASHVISLRHTLTSGEADETYQWGAESWIPVAGNFGNLESRVTVDILGAPQGLSWAVESLYLELTSAPFVQAVSASLYSPASTAQNVQVRGVAVTAEAFGSQIAVVTTDSDTILAVSDDGWTWRVVGGTLASEGFSLSAGPRFVAILGSDARPGEDPLSSFADSIHIYGVNAAGTEGALVGINRDTAIKYSGPTTSAGPRVENGMVEISHIMEYVGPDPLVQALAVETNLPIEGWFVTGFEDFIDLVNAMGGIDHLNIPYSVPSQCLSPPPTPNPAAGDTHVDGQGALRFSVERKCIPTQYLGSVAHQSNVVRTLSQGLLMKAAVAQVQEVGVLALPALLTILDSFVSTNLPAGDVLSLASTIYGVAGIDPGPMPTLTPADLATYGYGAYNLNPGNLPNVVVEGCNDHLWTSSGGQTNFNQFFVEGNYATFADFADGVLDTLPIYEYNSGDPTRPFNCIPKDYFTDDDGSIFEADINWMAERGITKGCNPPDFTNYCPNNNVTRGQMAAFLTRALGLTARLDNPFVDDDGSTFEADIEKLAAAGITLGCNPPINDRFCPNSFVTRGQMAAFLVRALGYTDNGGGDLFIDDDDSIFEENIDRLGTAGVTKGCNPSEGNTKFCPKANVSRGQMAAFLHRALG